METEVLGESDVEGACGGEAGLGRRSQDAGFAGCRSQGLGPDPAAWTRTRDLELQRRRIQPREVFLSRLSRIHKRARIPHRPLDQGFNPLLGHADLG